MARHGPSPPPPPPPPWLGKLQRRSMDGLLPSACPKCSPRMPLLAVPGSPAAPVLLRGQGGQRFGGCWGQEEAWPNVTRQCTAPWTHSKRQQCHGQPFALYPGHSPGQWLQSAETKLHCGQANTDVENRDRLDGGGGSGVGPTPHPPFCEKTNNHHYCMLILECQTQSKQHEMQMLDFRNLLQRRKWSSLSSLLSLISPGCI